MEDNREMGPRILMAAHISGASDSAFAVGVSHHPCPFYKAEMSTIALVTVLFSPTSCGPGMHTNMEGLTFPVPGHPSSRAKSFSCWAIFIQAFCQATSEDRTGKSYSQGVWLWWIRGKGTISAMVSVPLAVTPS